MRATSVVTVLLPFVPVIAAIGACASRANSSMSPMIGTPRIARTHHEGLAQRHAGRCDHAVGVVEQRFIERAEVHFGFGCELLQRRGLGRRRAVVGDRKAFVALVQITRARQAGTTQTDYDAARALLCHAHRTFSVARPISTRITEMIQKRTITFGSAQPLSSKW